MRFLDRRSYAMISILVALVTAGLKFGAFAVTGSVGLLSDALESMVNLVAALVALWALTLAARPADEEHAYGHTKAEYFSSSVEGGLIIIAAIGIMWTAIPRLFHPHPLEDVGLGLGIAILAAALNGGTAFVLLRAGRRLRSIALQADARHLFTDVWTTGGVLVAVILVAVTGWLVLDPIIALVVAANIVLTGWRLIHESGRGLLDTALPLEEQQTIARILDEYRTCGLDFHALRTRLAGTRRFVSFHVLVPGQWTVKHGHDVAEEIEQRIHQALPETTVFTHLEPQGDPIAYDDTELDRAPEQTARR